MIYSRTLLLLLFAFISFTMKANAMKANDTFKVNSSDSNSGKFFNDKARGWHWYEENFIDDAPLKKEKPLIKPQTPVLTPTQQIEKLRKDVETKLHAAIVNPNKGNIIAYIKAQKLVMSQGEKFANNWQKVIYTTPSLDETLKFPVNNTARHLYIKLEKEKKKEALTKLSKEYGLFYFFKGGCRYCHAFAPHVKRFAKKYNWDILAISLDGGSLPEFPNARRDNGIAETLNMQHVPALVAVNPVTQEMIPLAYGMVSETEIEDRALKLSGEKK